MCPGRGDSTTMPVDGRDLTISDLERVLFPATGFTKGQMIDYYMGVGHVMVPHLEDRPLTMKRFPHGVGEASFYEKHAPNYTPTWVRQVSVPSTAGGEVIYNMICDLPSLIWSANLTTIEFHVPLWRVPSAGKVPGPPDHMVFDLDPGEGTTIVECCVVAIEIARVLAERGLRCSAKTSGRKGLHVYAPLDNRPSWSDEREQAHQIAVDLEQAHPELVVSNMRKSRREKKVLIDWSQNSSSKTTVAAYSLRAGSEPSVSTPVTWEEVDRCGRGGDPTMLRFSPSEVLGRIDRLADLFAQI